MSSWLEEIGYKKFSNKELSLVVKLFEAIKEAEDMDDEDSTELMAEMIEKLDNAIHNVTELKKIMKGNL